MNIIIDKVLPNPPQSEGRTRRSSISTSESNSRRSTQLPVLLSVNRRESAGSVLETQQDDVEQAPAPLTAPSLRCSNVDSAQQHAHNRAPGGASSLTPTSRGVIIFRTRFVRIDRTNEGAPRVSRRRARRRSCRGARRRLPRRGWRAVRSAELAGRRPRSVRRCQSKQPAGPARQPWAQRRRWQCGLLTLGHRGWSSTRWWLRRCRRPGRVGPTLRSHRG